MKYLATLMAFSIVLLPLQAGGLAAASYAAVQGLAVAGVSLTAGSLVGCQ
jgi:hypothetical protein